jgi:phosphoadenosine phosphosulfate reductase
LLFDREEPIKMEAPMHLVSREKSDSRESEHLSIERSRAEKEPAAVEITALQNEAENWDAKRILGWGFSRFRSSIAMASGFGAEGMVLIDMASRLNPQFRLFTLDTNFLFPETHALMENIEKRYGISVERIYPELTPEAQEEQYGAALWASHPDRCCQLRKIQPLHKKLAGLQAWITAIRRDQTVARASAHKIEWDSKFGLVKLNPIVDLKWSQVWDYIRANKVPYNPLHDRGYPSIGCTHCTRAVEGDNDLRAGRWSGFDKTECGLHLKDVIGNGG